MSEVFQGPLATIFNLAISDELSSRIANNEVTTPIIIQSAEESSVIGLVPILELELT